MKKRGLEKFNNLIDSLSQLPTVGKKSATRYAYHMILKDPFSALKLAHSIEDAIASITKCEICGSLSEDKFCEICQDNTRDKSKLCIVSSSKDIFIIEESVEYNGRYFVLENLNEQVVNELIGTVHSGITEVIFAFSPSLLNDGIILFIEDKLKNQNITFTKIAQGVPTGVSLENVDMMSLSKALTDRIKI